MTQDEIIEMAREAGFHEHDFPFKRFKFEALVKLAAAKEREACAKWFDELAEKATSARDLVYLNQTAALIRARGEA